MSDQAKLASKGKDVKTGWVDIEFLRDHGSYKKGDTVKYHESTVKAAGLNKPGVGKIVKEHTKYVPNKEEK